jgi:hypothetical protein
MKTVTNTKNGVMVLGMHHLGMSMLSGLLVQQFGYIVGKLLIGAGPSNPETKGHFELSPAKTLCFCEIKVSYGVWESSNKTTARELNNMILAIWNLWKAKRHWNF